MKISGTNHMIGGVVDVNTCGSINSDAQVIPYKGNPVRITSNGVLSFDLAAIQVISSFALFGIKHLASDYTQCTVDVKLRNGGSGGTLTKSLTYQLDSIIEATDYYPSQGETFEQVSADHVELTFSSVAASSLLLIDSIWVGDSVHFDEVSDFTHEIVDPTLFEKASKGNVFATQKRMFRTLKMSNIRIHDNLANSNAQTTRDYESVSELIAKCGLFKDVGVFPSDGFPVFHARFSSVPVITRAAGLQYIANLDLKEI